MATFHKHCKKKHNTDSFLEIEEMEVENEIELDREGHVANTCKDIKKKHNKACFILNLEVVGWLVLLLYIQSQQLWSLRDGQFT